MTEAGLRQAKLVLLGDMGAGKSSLVIRFVKGQYFDHLVRGGDGGRAVCRGVGLRLGVAGMVGRGEACVPRAGRTKK